MEKREMKTGFSYSILSRIFKKKFSPTSEAKLPQFSLLLGIIIYEEIRVSRRTRKEKKEPVARVSRRMRVVMRTADGKPICSFQDWILIRLR